MNHYALLFFGQALNFLIAVINIRAASKGRMFLTGLSDFAFCVVNFVLIQRIAAAGTSLEILAYALGGMCGSIIAVRITRRWDVQ